MVDVIDYGGLPGRERNLDPKSRSLGVIFNFLGLLPYARAGAEAVARGESFWGGTPQYERQRQALQQYYNEALGYPFNRSWRSCAMADLVQAGPRLAGALVLSAGLGARPWDAGPRRDPDTAPAHEQQPVPRPDRTAFRGSGSGGG